MEPFSNKILKKNKIKQKNIYIIHLILLLINVISFIRNIIIISKTSFIFTRFILLFDWIIY